MGHPAAIIFLIAYILFFMGYIMNIVKIIRNIHEPFSTLSLLRLIGIAVPPLGSFLGWMF